MVFFTALTASKLWVGGSIPSGQTNIHAPLGRFLVFKHTSKNQRVVVV
jgi:hypothetical protein